MTGQRVETPQGMGVIVGWHGPLAIVSLDAGGYVEVPETAHSFDGIRYNGAAGMSSIRQLDTMRAAPVDSSSLSAGVVLSGG
jgi:hypothetical protein